MIETKKEPVDAAALKDLDGIAPIGNPPAAPQPTDDDVLISSGDEYDDDSQGVDSLPAIRPKEEVVHEGIDQNAGEDETPVRLIGFHEMDSALVDEAAQAIDANGEGAGAEGSAGETGNGASGGVEDVENDDSASSLSDDQRSTGTTGYPDEANVPSVGSVSPTSSASRRRRASSVKASAKMSYEDEFIDEDEDDYDDYRVYDDEDLDPDFQGGGGAAKKVKPPSNDATSATPTKRRKKASSSSGTVAEPEPEEAVPKLEAGADTQTDTVEKKVCTTEGKSNGGNDPDTGKRFTESPDAVTLDDDDDDDFADVADDEDDAASSSSSPSKAPQLKKVQMQLRFKCLDKNCPKKFITKVALNTHCKRNHPEMLKQRAMKEEQLKMQEIRLKRRQTTPMSALRGGRGGGGGGGRGGVVGGAGGAGIRPASVALNGLTSSPIKSSPFGGGVSTSPSSGFMTRSPMSSPGMGGQAGFSHLNSFSQNGVRQPGFNNPMNSRNSPFNSSSSTPTYSSLKTTLLRGTSGLFNQQQQHPTQQNAFALSTAAPSFGGGMGVASNPRFPSSPFGSPQKSATSPFGSPQKSPYGGVGFGTSLSPSSSNLRGGTGALVPSISSLNSSPGSSQRPFQPQTFTTTGLVGRGGGGGVGMSSQSFPAAGGMGGWPTLTSGQQRQPRPNGVRPPLQRPLFVRGGVRQPTGVRAPSSGVGNPRFTRVHASQFLSSSPSSTPLSPSRPAVGSGAAAKLGSPGKSAANETATKTHKCRFSSCQGKTFLTEQALVSHYTRHHDKSRTPTKSSSGTSTSTPSASPMSSPSKPRLKCSECTDATFLTQEALDRHTKRVHKKDSNGRGGGESSVKLEREQREDDSSSVQETTQPKREKPDDDMDFNDDDDDYFNIDDVKFDFDENSKDAAEEEAATPDVKVPLKDHEAAAEESDIDASTATNSRGAPSSVEPAGNNDDQNRGRRDEGDDINGGYGEDGDVGDDEEVQEVDEDDDYTALGIIGKLEDDEDAPEEGHSAEEGEEGYFESYGNGDEIADYSTYDYLLVNGLKPCYVPMDRLDVDPADVPYFTHYIKPKKMMKGQSKFRSAAVVKQERW